VAAGLILPKEPRVSYLPTVIAAFLALFGFSATVVAQATYSTPAGSLVQGTVPLACDRAGANCAPTAGDTNGVLVQPARAASFWRYAPPVGGITNSTTAVTVKAAGTDTDRNYVTSMVCTADALGAGTDLVIRDGAAETEPPGQSCFGWRSPRLAG